MNTRRLRALAHLAAHYAVQIMTSKARVSEGEGGGAREFLEKYSADGIYPLDARDRATIPALMSCIACGLCDGACPVLDVLPGRAFEGPAAYATSLPRTLVDLPLWRGLHACSLCGACDAACPVHVPLQELFDSLRRRVARVRRDLVPASIRDAIEAATRTGNLHAKPLPWRSPAVAGAAPPSTALFACGCRARDPAAGGPASRLLRSMGAAHAEVSGCCGACFEDAGVTAPDDVRSKLQEALAGASEVVCEDARCARHLRTAPALVGRGLEVRTLEEKLSGLPSRWPGGGPVAVKESCDLAHHLGRPGAVRRLLGRAGATLIPGRSGEAPCAGECGLLPWGAPAVATADALRTVEAAASAGASILVASGEAAAEHLRQAQASLAPGSPAARLPIRSLAEALLPAGSDPRGAP